MGKINVGRLLVGAMVAGIICFVGDGVLHGVILSEGWKRIAAGMGRTPGDHPAHMVLFLAYDLAKGFVAVWIYAAVRPRFGAGPTTAVLAGLITWFATIPVPLFGLLPMGFFPVPFWAIWSGLGAIPVVAGTLAGGWLYKEEGAPAPT